MSMIDKFFDINMVLMTVFSSLEAIRDEKNIELIYDIDATIPKELKGDPEALSYLLTQILTFVFENSKNKEIVLTLLAPKDFLYEESISFEIRELGVNEVKIVSFLNNGLTKNLELLNGEIIYEHKNPADIHINIPFKLNELGNRRYYRLPDIVMLGKKVLLLCKSKKVAESIEKMFKYFLYNVVVGVDEYKRQGSDLSQYDILLVEDKLTNQGLEKMISKVQKITALKYVLLQDSNYVRDNGIHLESVNLVKPVMQESIYELIISLFEDQIQDRSIQSKEKNTIINMEKYIDENFQNGEKTFEQKSREYNLNSIKEERKEPEKIILNSEAGEQNAKKHNTTYVKELKKFLESFDHSDLYFRQIVNEKQTWKIKDFCIDLEKQAKNIGAHSMSNFAERVSLLFVYDKLDTLPIYTGKYHIELKQLITEIKGHLHLL